jgi:hypothetical protein
MKTLNFLLVFAVAILFAACEKNELGSNSYKLNSRTSYDYTDAGDIHNACLSEIIESPNEWSEMDREEGFTTIDGIMSTYFDEVLEESYENDGLEDAFDEMCDDWDFSDYLSLGNSRLSSLISGSAINVHETSMILRLRSLFSMNFVSLTEPQKVQRIQDSLDVFLAQIANYPANYPQSEVRAAVYLTYGSSSYWDTYGDTNGEVEKWIQIDAIGYLIGWGEAWLDDQGPGYSNSGSAQWKRIKAGIAGGVAGSSGKWFKATEGEIFPE